MLRTLAQLALYAVPIPSAFFIGRSIYLHLLLGWQLVVPQWLNLGIATVAGICIEILAIVSVFNALALYRWNQQPRVQSGWETAPFTLALICVGLYALTATILLVLLEAIPEAATYAPVLFPSLAIVGAINLAMFDQHESRLARYGLTWNLSRERHANVTRTSRERRTNDTRTQHDDTRTQHDDTRTSPNDDRALACMFPGCSETFSNRFQRAGHMNAHRKESGK